MGNAGPSGWNTDVRLVDGVGDHVAAGPSASEPHGSMAGVRGQEAGNYEEEDDDDEANLGFRSDVHFPPFEEIPNENNTWHRDYLHLAHDHTVVMTRHWCLLGEIVDVSCSIRVRLTATDKQGRYFRVHIHVRDDSSTMKLEDMVVGNTIAIMCPEKHSFMDGTVGIRQEGADTAFVFRAGLRQLMEEGAKLLVTPQCCHECGQETAKKCLKCGVTFYCSKPCQVNQWRAVHRKLCSQMLVLMNLLRLDFTRKPQGGLADFCELSRAQAHLAGDSSVVACQLPRPCTCGFQGMELGNSDNCPRLGFANHIDFPPAACLPGVDASEGGSVSRQFFYDANGAPFRHWAIVIEVLEVSGDGVVGETRFGEKVHLGVTSSWDKSAVQRGNCIVGCHATWQGIGDKGEIKVTVEDQKQICQFRTQTGWKGLSNAEAQVYYLLASDQRFASQYDASLCSPVVYQDFESLGDLPQDDGAKLKSFFKRQLMCEFLFCNGTQDMWETRLDIASSLEASAVAEKNSTAPLMEQAQANKSSPSNTESSLASVSADLRAVLQAHPNGLRGGLLPGAFETCHGRRLDHRALGFKSLTKLLEACPDLQVGREPPRGQLGKVGSDVWVQLRQASVLPAIDTSKLVLPAADTPKPAQAQLAAAVGPKRMRPSEIYFTHDSIHSKFRDGRQVRETLRQLQEGSVRVAAIPKIKVCWHAAKGYDARYWTYTGNRRLWVFRQLQSSGHVQDLEVTVVKGPVPGWRLTTRDGGKTVRVRGDESVPSSSRPRRNG
eukprot:TRINITY_DN60908_c0_g1_i1.p1 TRINITY_DN60908_c0_g1~~TRINITY_DN60908_c0_g1_i1.p1  ORF type:complete len:774 (-),score=93.98 TRINITY_DN60908_c0_g1_i1:54-2375(-)